MSINLLEKTELWIHNITLDDANLTEIADVVAKVLGLPAGKVMVVDVRPNHITFDLLEHEIPQENFLGKEKDILEAVKNIKGVTLYENTYIDSNGILGQICAELTGEEEKQILSTVKTMTDDITYNVLHRAIVFPTGFELQQGLIRDTNTPFIKKQLEENGYRVTVGEIMADDLWDIQQKLEDALNRGFGLIVTSGGVGAEDKDKTVEAISAVDQSAATPYIVKFKKGTGRHVKDGVRIGVGKEGMSLMVSLPGPHDEVELAMPVLLRGLKETWSKEKLADCLAGVLASKWQNKMKQHHHMI